jgi:hypothetical protein
MHDGQRRREQEVGALQRSEAIDYSGNEGVMVRQGGCGRSDCVHQWRCIIVRAGGIRRSEHYREVKWGQTVEMYYSPDGVEKCYSGEAHCIRQRWVCIMVRAGGSRRLEHCREGK